MMKSISLFAGVMGAAAVAMASPEPATAPAPATPAVTVSEGQVPAEFASLPSTDAIAVAFVSDPGAFVNSISRYMPAGMIVFTKALGDLQIARVSFGAREFG